MGNEQQQDGDDIEEEDSTCWDDEVEVHQHSVHVVVDGEESTFQHRQHRTCCIQLVVVGSEDDGNHVLHMDDEEVHKENGAERDTVLDRGVGMRVFHSRVGLRSHVRTDLHTHRPPCFRWMR